MLDAAIIAVAVGAVLTLLGFALHVYYYERLLSPERDINEIMDLFDIAKYSMYARFAGIAVALVGAILVVRAVMRAGLASASAAARQVPLRSVLLLVVAMAMLMTVTTMAVVYVYETEPDIGENAMKLVSRMIVYLPQGTVVLGMFAMLVVTIFLRNASSGRGAAASAGPPG